jgi:hypothetical protein
MTISFIATTPRSAAGMVTPPAWDVPVHAAGSFHAVASSSSSTGRRLRQCGGRLAADGSGGGPPTPGASVTFLAACANAQDNPTK